MIKLDSANNYYMWTKTELEVLKKKLRPEDRAAMSAYFEDLFAWPLESVTTKKAPPPGGSIHDYASLGTYWWPNPETPDGLPYLRRDGFANPDGLSRYDKDKFKRLAYLVYHGSLLFCLTGEGRYLELISSSLRHWFINPATKMNPHLEYGQFIPGIAAGRPEGIIDYAGNFAFALNVLKLIQDEGFLPTDLSADLAEWHGSFRDWLLNSRIGQDERAAANNHGVFYDLCLCAIERFLGLPVTVRGGEFLKTRIQAQIAADGSLPRETVRTKSMGYSFMALKGMLETAKMIGEAEGKEALPSLAEGLKECARWFWEKAVLGKRTWPYVQTAPFDEGLVYLFGSLANPLYDNLYPICSIHVDDAKVINTLLVWVHKPLAGAYT
jgi:hypothetical protein